MKRLFKIALLAVFFTVSVSCSSDDEKVGISNITLEGKVFGVAFTAEGGKAFDSNQEISVNITNIVADCISTIFDYKLSVSTYVPAEVGVYENQNVVFNQENKSPLNFIGGTVEVVELTASEITVKIKANSDTSNSIEGKFTIPYCK